MLTSSQIEEINYLSNIKRLNLNHIKNSSFSDIIFHTKLTNARQILWHIKNETMNIPVCEICDNVVSWNSDLFQYRRFCSKKCSGIGTTEIAKQTSINNNNGIHHTQTKTFLSKRMKTSIEKYGVDHYSKTIDFKEKTKQTNKEKYGVEYPIQNDDIKEKTKITNKEKYGVEYPIQNDDIKEKTKQTNKEKYGVEYPIQNDDIKEKFKSTNKEMYWNNDAPYKEELIKKRINTFKNNYYSSEVLSKLNDPDWLENEQKNKTLTQISSELNISLSNLGKYYKKYNIPINKVNNNTSDGEKEVTDFIKSFGINVINNSSNIIPPKEIDIFLPDYNIAIEYNGVYFHTENNGKDREYHLNKTNQCEKNNIQLLHIYDYEWNDLTKKEIWKSMIKSKIGISEKIYARRCIIKEVNTQDARKFMNENHLDGFVGGKYKLGLYYNNELVQCIIISKSRFNKKYNYELIRLATKKYITVIGGISKLLSNINLKGSLITYANRRYSIGKSYISLGMVQHKSTPPNYFYTSKNGSIIETRHKYQKHKLINFFNDFDKNKSEWENMKMNGFDRIWDCGNLTFAFVL